ncbi:MAG: ExbD/TolR family protein [Nevskiaceae bacterium]
MRSVRRALRELERYDIASKGEAPINLVPMIDILVVLVLYLLIGTIFKQFTILQLNLPGPSQAVPADQRPPLDLKVVLRRQRLEVHDRNGTVGIIDNTLDGRPAAGRGAAGHDTPALNALLAEVKRRNPEEESVTLLLEPDIQYDVLVQVMDAARVFPPGSAELAGGIPMFPSIAIGDAPPATAPAPVPVVPVPAP